MPLLNLAVPAASLLLPPVRADVAWIMLCCRVRLEGQGQAQGEWQAGMLRQTEQADLISYGLIPEFVGRFPVIAPLKVNCV